MPMFGWIGLRYKEIEKKVIGEKWGISLVWKNIEMRVFLHV